MKISKTASNWINSVLIAGIFAFAGYQFGVTKGRQEGADMVYDKVVKAQEAFGEKSLHVIDSLVTLIDNLQSDRYTKTDD